MNYHTKAKAILKVNKGDGITAAETVADLLEKNEAEKIKYPFLGQNKEYYFSTLPDLNRFSFKDKNHVILLNAAYEYTRNKADFDVTELLEQLKYTIKIYN